MEAAANSDARYQNALETERRIYENCLEVHELPEIFHYWSYRYIHPRLMALGFGTPDELFEKGLREQCAAGGGKRLRFASLGSGNCDLDVSLAVKLRAAGYEDFIVDCFDLNEAMLERGRVAAESAGVGGNLRFVASDLNGWRSGHEYDAAMANQSLHHVVNLEGLFDEVKRSLRPEGSLIVSDMIGRNGHQRWPEALAIVREYWRKLPPSYRFNRQFGYYNETFEDWDCSVEGFEGVRAQDILPLLLREFQFEMFFGFANAIDPFLDRGFGGNFDAKAAWDRAFVDEVHARDVREMEAGRITPTHLLAVLKQRGRAVECVGNLKPEACVRLESRVASAPAAEAGDAYQWDAWPHDPQTELRIACARLAEITAVAQERVARTAAVEEDLAERTAWARRLEAQLEERAAWARRLEAQLEERTAWARRLERDVDARTAWAHGLDALVEERTALALGLQAEHVERTEWALRLDRELAEAQAWALQLRAELEEETARANSVEAELSSYLRNPLRFVRRLFRRRDAEKT